MKVVLFCGGLGMRLREHSESIPKPMVLIGYRPILWHVMKYYAHFGHKDFILALGYRGDMIREFFLNYREEMATDFVMTKGGGKIELLGPDIADWRITFVDTGVHSNLGQRLLRVRAYLEGEEMFLANYSDGLSDLPLDEYIAGFRTRDAIASCIAVRPTQSFHRIQCDAQGIVSSIAPVSEADSWVNGGFFCLRRQIFDYVNEGEELVVEPFHRLIGERRLWAHKYHGYWAAMDTFKDKITFDRMEARGDCPWMIWRTV